MRNKINAAVLVGGLVLAACSSSGSSNAGLSAKQLADKALHAMESASAFHVSGSVSDSGKTTHLDMHLGAHGGEGTIGVPGGTLHVLAVGGSTYFKAPDSLYKQFVSPDQQAATLALLHDKWVKVPVGNSEFGDLVSFSSKDAFVQALKQNSNASNTFTKGPSKSIDGVDTVSFVDPKDKTTAYVRKSGTPYPVEVDERGGQGVLHFDSWNDAVNVKAPPASEVVDLSKLLGH